MTVITRFAPSPTGFLHMGGVRTALFSYLYARQNKGKFILRIEDTDTARNRDEWTKALVEDLAWLGIKHDGEYILQSSRTAIHQKYLEKMIADGHAFISKETPKEEGQRSEVIRFKNPDKIVTVHDLIRGEVKVDTTDLGDFVIARSITEPLFHLAVVVDDFEMGITHVIRAEEHLANTPRQILIQEAIGATRPVYAHLPLVLATDKSKLSKRKHGETVSLGYYRNKAYLPEALINFVALLGWNPGTEQEIFSLDELINQFDLEKVQKAGAVFNVEKLDWFNREYIKKMSLTDFIHKSTEYYPKWLKNNEQLLLKVSPLVKEKITTFTDIENLFLNELAFVQNLPDYNKELLLWKKNPSVQNSIKHLTTVKNVLEKIPGDAFTSENIRSAIWSYVEEKGKGDVLWPLRVALTGKEKSPDPFISATVLGKKESLERIQTAIDKFS